MDMKDVKAKGLSLLVLVSCFFAASCSGDRSKVVVLNEAVSSNSNEDVQDEDRDTPDWFEIYNTEGHGVSIEGWTITDDIDDPYQWTFPEYTLSANEVLRIWASKKDRVDISDGSAIFHTNFKLSAKGETLYLYDETGVLVDSLEVPRLPPDVSIGHSESSDDPVYYLQPTPGQVNSSEGYVGLVDSEVVFSDVGGITEALELSLTGAKESEVLRYTLDATLPNESSPIYQSELPIAETTVVRTRIFREGFISSRIQSHTYLVGVDHSLPVVTLATEPDNFFDLDTGIYVKGREGLTPQDPGFGDNFWMDWETDIHFSFYEPDGTLGTSFDAGVKIFGSKSRERAQRSLSIFARAKYGTKEIEYPFFSQLKYDKFQSLVLRNSGQDWMSTMLRDGALTSLMDGSGLDTQAYRPTAVYLNQEYWGLHNLREKVNNHLLASKHGVDADDIDLLILDGIKVDGSKIEYYELKKFIAENDLSLTDNYQYVSDQIDIDNFIIYQIAQIYFDNDDWPGNNIKFWKTPETKWRWILYDTDFSFGRWNRSAYLNDSLTRAMASDSEEHMNAPWSTLFLRKLAENPEFRNRFVNRFADELNGRFLPVNVSSHIDSLASVIESEMPKQLDRWAPLAWSDWESLSSSDLMDRWRQSIADMKHFGVNRSESLKEHIKNKFELTAVHSLTIENSNPSQGYVQLNSLSISGAVWSGDYFAGVPITLSAIAEEGFEFSHWVGASDSTNAEIILDPQSSLSIQPVFIEKIVEVE